MSMRVLTSDLAKLAGHQVELAGWLHKKRLLGGLTFVILRDRGGTAQIKLEDKTEIEKLRNLQTGTVLQIIGKVKKDKRAPLGLEVNDPKITVLVPVTDTPPIEIDKPIDHRAESLDTLFEHRVLNLRNPKEQAIFKVSSSVVQAVSQFFNQNDFVQVFTPKLLSGATEGGAEVFKLDYYGRQATLAQSPQFYKQMLVGAFERVFEIAPVYRAEPSMTTRHLSEYISIDMEMGFITAVTDVMAMITNALHAVVETVWHERPAELALWQAKRPKLPKVLPTIQFDEVHELFSRKNKDKTISEPDLRPAEERFICDYALDKFGSEAIFVTDFPAQAMKFYHMKSGANPNWAARFDLLFRGVEITTGSQREHRYDVLTRQLKAIGGDPTQPGFKYFLESMRYGMPPHGGAGWGLERTVEKLLGLRSVKEASLFVRDMQRLSP